jgi:hypothetical protein
VVVIVLVVVVVVVVRLNVLEHINIEYKIVYIQGVPGGKDLTSGECSLGQTIPI